jgi:hypothetical protein
MANETVDRAAGEVRETETETLPALLTAEPQSLAVQMAMAEHNQDVISARSFPRSIARAHRAINELVAMDEISAKECVYAVPRDGKTIRGPSIRLAEIIASSWGNCHCASRVVHVDRIEKYVESEGIFHDLETGLKRTARTRKSIAKRDGGIYSQDMIMTAGNAAASIAMREAILKGVPKAVWRKAFEHAEMVIKGNVTTLRVRRDEAMKALLGIGVTPERVFGALGVEGLEDIGLDQLADLFAMYQGVKNGDSDIDEVFPAVAKGKDDKAGAGKSSKIGDRLDNLAGQGGGKKAGGKAKEKPADDGKQGQADAGQTGGQGDQGQGKPAETQQTGDQAQQGATGAQQQAEAPATDPILVARKAGTSARRRGLNRKAVPQAYKEEGHEAERDAWLEAYDAEQAKEQAG